MNRSPEPWATFGKQVIDSNQKILCQCHSEEDSERIVACVNFCRGIKTDDLTGIVEITPDGKLPIQKATSEACKLYIKLKCGEL